MTRIKLLLSTLLVTVMGFAFTLVPVAVHAASTPTTAACQALGNDATCSKPADGGVDIGKVVKTILQILSVTIGVLSVIMIMVGGFKYITSAGDTSKATSARSTITYAIVGLVIAVFAQAIVQFVLDKL